MRRLCVLVLATSSCARPAPPAHTVKLSPPSAETTGTPAPMGRAAQSELARLEGACLAEPWTAKDASYSPKLLSQETSERLAGLMDPQGCRDIHPGLPPGRFGAGLPIPAAECRYGIARIYFEWQHWTEAARWFRRVAFEHAEETLGIFAAQLYLQSLNVLAHHGAPERPQCYQLMAEDAERIACTYCGRGENQEQCSELRRIRFDVGYFLAKGVAPPDGNAPCTRDERPVGGRCEPLPPMVPDDCAR